MAFHIACPLTCRRICDCDLGFPAALRSAAAKERFLDEIEAVREFLDDSWTVRAVDDVDEGSVQVLVPRVPRVVPVAPVDADEGDGEDFKLSAIQRQALTATVELEDYVRRLETGGAAKAASGEAAKYVAGEEQGLSTVKVICRICLSGGSEGTEKAIKMLPCKTCGKKYHKSCLKSWAANRDLFNWNSWSCPSCRLCEVCRRTGDPNKLMYCKRCDGAYHCYCQQPPHKNVGHGPYLCPKHTRCHSCDSAVPGSGPSTRWFLAQTCCDACGRLFVKGNYCPVCLKVYRDSEVTPMVCCDLCERWVHCLCDGISDEKYQQFQTDQNLEYRCAACRGDCYQIIDMDDAVRELWKRKDFTERDLIANLRATAGLPPLEDNSYSNGEYNGLVIRKSDNVPLKFSVKGLGDNLLKNCSETGKNAANKKLANKGYKIKIVGKSEEAHQDIEKLDEVKPPPEVGLLDPNVDDMKSGNDVAENFNFSTAESFHSNGTKSCFDQSISKQASRDPVSIVPKVKIKRSQLHDVPAGASSGVHANKNKLVIHLGTRNANVPGSPKSETSSCHRDHEVAAASFGSEDTGQQKPKDNEERLSENWSRLSKHDLDKGVKSNSTKQMKSPKSGVKEKALIKFAKHSNKHSKEKGNIVAESEIYASSPQRPSKNNFEILGTADTENMKISKKLLPNSQNLSPNESKPSLKLKFKNPYLDQRSSWASQGEEESSVKKQRSKRKRPATTNKVGSWQDFGGTPLSQENQMEESLDASWILKKLGKDAIGKRIEVQLSDSSWYPGAVADINLKTLSMSVSLDNGRSQTVELGKQVIRFIRQKHKRTKL